MIEIGAEEREGKMGELKGKAKRKTPRGRCKAGKTKRGEMSA